MLFVSLTSSVSSLNGERDAALNPRNRGPSTCRQTQSRVGAGRRPSQPLDRASNLPIMPVITPMCVLSATSLVSLARVRSGRYLFLASTSCSACQTARLAVRSAGHSQSVLSRVKAASAASPSSRRLFTCSALARTTRDAGPYTRHTLPASTAPSMPAATNGGDKATGEQPASSRSGGCCGGGGRKRRRTAYVALGSNMDDRVAMIEQACREMDRRGIRVRRTSSLWETQPMYVLDQGMFVNGVCEVGSCCLMFPICIYLDSKNSTQSPPACALLRLI